METLPEIYSQEETMTLPPGTPAVADQDQDAPTNAANKDD